MSKNIDENKTLANARRKLKKYRDQHENEKDFVLLTSDDPLGKQFEEFLVDRTFSPFDIDDECSSGNIPQITEQSEIQVQTIGLLVAEKSDLTAKLSQSLKQLERKQCEIDELFGRLKASREKIQDLENSFLNSTSNIQKRELSVKESEKENFNLKLENIRLSQSIEDLKREIKCLKENSSENLRDEIRAKDLEDQIGLKEENQRLKSRIGELEYLVIQLEKETETIGDYIRLYQDQRQQLQKRYEEKDFLLEKLTRENDFLQKKLSQLDEYLRDNFGLTSNSLINLIDESKSEKCFVGEKSHHQCSTCRGQIEILMSKSVFLYIPNLIGYIRLICLFFSWIYLHYPVIFLCFYSIQCLLDGLDGWTARKFNQISKFGVWFDVVIDNLGRSLIWNSISSMGFFISSVEWITFVALNSLGTQWKSQLCLTNDFIVKNLMKNGFRSPFGFLCVVLGLHCLPLMIFIRQNLLYPPSIEMFFNLFLFICFIGRLLSFYSEVRH